MKNAVSGQVNCFHSFIITADVHSHILVIGLVLVPHSLNTLNPFRIWMVWIAVESLCSNTSIRTKGSRIVNVMVSIYREEIWYLHNENGIHHLCSFSLVHASWLMPCRRTKWETNNEMMEDYTPHSVVHSVYDIWKESHRQTQSAQAQTFSGCSNWRKERNWTEVLPATNFHSVLLSLLSTPQWNTAVSQMCIWCIWAAMMMTTLILRLPSLCQCVCMWELANV